jgi:hypothetical protein
MMDTMTTFQEIWNDNQSILPFEPLSDELNTLRMALRSEAHCLEHDIAVAQLALAEGAALALDGPKMLEHLHKAGDWTLAMAEKMNAGVAVAAIRVSLQP